jgi:hypothetical protein
MGRCICVNSSSIKFIAIGIDSRLTFDYEKIDYDVDIDIDYCWFCIVIGFDKLAKA